MSIVAVVGDCATTTAVGLVAAWPSGRRVVLAELDPSGGCLSAWLGIARSPNLSELVAAPSVATLARFESVLQRTAGGTEVLVGSTRAVEATAAVAAAAHGVIPLLAAVHDPLVVADVGRVTATLPPSVMRADVALVVHRQHQASASAAVVGLERLAHTCDLLTVRAIPFVVGLVGDRPYGCDEVAHFTRAAAVVPVAVDPWAAAVFAGRAASVRRLRRSALVHSLAHLAKVVEVALGHVRDGEAWRKPDATDPSGAEVRAGSDG